MLGRSCLPSLVLLSNKGLVSYGTHSARIMCHSMQLIWQGETAFASALKLIAAAERTMDRSEGELETFVYRQSILRPAKTKKQVLIDMHNCWPNSFEQVSVRWFYCLSLFPVQQSSSVVRLELRAKDARHSSAQTKPDIVYCRQTDSKALSLGLQQALS